MLAAEGRKERECAFLMLVALCTFCRSSEGSMNSEFQLWFFHIPAACPGSHDLISPSLFLNCKTGIIALASQEE